MRWNISLASIRDAVVHVACGRERLEVLKSKLSKELDGTFDQFFGGSIAKHTYVDGLSDIDSLGAC